MNEYRPLLRRFFSRLRGYLHSGVVHPEDLEEVRQVLLLNLLIFFGSIFLAILGLLALLQRHYFLALADGITLAVFVSFLFLLRKKRNNKRIAFTGIILSGAFFCLLMVIGGVASTAFVWIFTYPLLSIFLLGNRTGAIATMALLLAASIIFLLSPAVDFITDYDPNLAIRVIASYLSIFIFAFTMEYTRKLIYRRLSESNEKLEKADRENRVLIEDLKKTLEEINQLRGILPICASCKKIRNDEGYWEQVEKYISSKSKATFSHGICPDCAKKLYGEYVDTLNQEKKENKK